MNEASKIAACHGPVYLILLFTGNNIEDVFSETVTLLTILFTTPMTTAGSERCLSALKRFQTFLRNTVNQEKLNASARQKEREAKAIILYYSAVLFVDL